MLKNYSVIYIVLLILSLLTSYLIIGPFFPYVGISFFFMWLALGTLILKRRRTGFDLTLLLFCITFAGFIVIRANPWLTFFNILGVIFLGAASLLHGKDHTSFLSFIGAPLIALSESSKIKQIIRFDTAKLSHGYGKLKTLPLMRMIASIVITLILLAVILPLLASANALFARYLQSIIYSLYFDGILKYIFGDKLGENIIRIIMATIIFFLTKTLLSYAIYGEPVEKKVSKEEFQWSSILLLPKIVIALVITAFFFTQIELYFASDEMLRTLNSSNSEQTREIFGQLLVVSFIIFGLIYLDTSKKLMARILTYILVLQGIFLAAIGFKSVYDYIALGGFTTKRLYGVTGIFWLLSVYFLFVYDYIHQKVTAKFIKQVVIVTAVTLLGVNVANFDYLIYHVKPSKSYMGIDYEYLVRLSHDAYSDRDIYNKLKDSDDPNQEQAFRNLANKIYRLQNKYKEFDIREFNIAEYHQYLSIKNLDVTAFPNHQKRKIMIESQK